MIVSSSRGLKSIFFTRKHITSVCIYGRGPQHTRRTASCPLATAALTALILTNSPANASSHGNALVMSGPLNGQVFIMNEKYMSLYFYSKVTNGVSKCNGACAKAWPPALMPAGTQMPESYSLIRRGDGTMQIAFKGQPLYLYAKDRKIGDTKGDGAQGLWVLARP